MSFKTPEVLSCFKFVMLQTFLLVSLYYVNFWGIGCSPHDVGWCWMQITWPSLWRCDFWCEEIFKDYIHPQVKWHTHTSLSYTCINIYKTYLTILHSKWITQVYRYIYIHTYTVTFSHIERFKTIWNIMKLYFYLVILIYTYIDIEHPPFLERS